MAEEIQSQTSDLDKASSDTQVDRDTTVTDVDVGQAERIRGNTASFDHSKQASDLENQRRDRTQNDQSVQTSLDLQKSVNAVITQMLTNMVTNVQEVNAQSRKHGDHTHVQGTPHGSGEA